MRFNQNINISKDTMPKSIRKGKNIFCYTMISLAVFHFIVFYVMVNINSILLAFKSFIGYDEAGNLMYEFSLGNFERLWRDMTSSQSVMWAALWNTFLFFSQTTFILIPLCFFISYFLYKKLWGTKIFKVVFFIPSIISSVVLVALFKNFIAVDGPLNYIIKSLGGNEIPSLLTNARYAKWVILAFCAWTGFGVNVVLYQGAMSRIPDSVIEAAKLDGVGMWKEMFLIITPMMWPTLSTTLILAFTGIFTASGPQLLFTQGDYDTMTISYWIFDQVNFSNSYEYPSAIGLIFTVIGLPIVLGIRRIMNKLFEDVEY